MTQTPSSLKLFAAPLLAAALIVLITACSVEAQNGMRRRQQMQQANQAFGMNSTGVSSEAQGESSEDDSPDKVMDSEANSVTSGASTRRRQSNGRSDAGRPQQSTWSNFLAQLTEPEQSRFSQEKAWRQWWHPCHHQYRSDKMAALSVWAGTP